MRIQLEACQAYQHSLRWKLSQAYFERQGLDAFLLGDVPFAVTSNEVFARQNALLLLTQLQSRPDISSIVRVLELGAGMGVFALNFIKAFEALCQQTGLPYAQSLEYWLTDLSLKSLRSLAHHPAFAQRIKQGQLKLLALDASDLSSLQSLDGQQPELASFQAIIANYFFCTQPVAMLHSDKGQCWQLSLDSFAQIEASSQSELIYFAQNLNAALQSPQFKPDIPQELEAPLRLAQHQLNQALPYLKAEHPWLRSRRINPELAHWLAQRVQAQLPASHQADTLPQLIETHWLEPLLQLLPWSQQQLESSFQLLPIAPESYFSECAADWIPELSSGQSQLFSYPQRALQILKQLLPHLAAEGLLLLTDKSGFDPIAQATSELETPLILGNSLAHNLNFELLASWFKQQAYACRWTRDEAASVQTLVAGPELSPALEKRFNQELVENNLNLDCQCLFDAGTLALKQNQQQQAIQYWLRALKHRPADANLIYRLGVAYLYQKQPAKVLQYKDHPHDGYFMQEEFSYLWAEAYRELGDYQQALDYYLELLTAQRPLGKLNLQIGICLQQLGRSREALEYLLLAQSQEPDNLQLQSLISQARQAL